MFLFFAYYDIVSSTSFSTD